jgi:MoaA/NifB/PqqE/SkfB family radical SAM enzyme
MQIANSRYSVASLLSRAIPTFLRRGNADQTSITAPTPASPDSIDPSTRALFANGPLPSNFSINLGVAPCNHSCRFCPQSVHKPKKAHWLDPDILRKVASEMPEKGMSISISSYSETLAAPNLIPAVKVLKEIRPNLSIVMATNGSLMREEVVKGLIDAGLDHYSYSFDAPTRETFQRLIQVDHFDRVWKNLDRIVDLRNELGSKMLITTHIMGFEEFKESYQDFKAYWEKRVNLVYWREVGNWGGETWGLETKLAEAGFHIPKSRERTRRMPCSSIFMHFKLQHDGRYAPCVAAVPDYISDEERHNVPYIGNAHEMTWMEAWERLSAMRQAHLRGDWDAFACCKTCNIWSLWPDHTWKDLDQPRADGTKFHVPGIETAR